MTREQAQRKAARLWGKSASLRVYEGMTSPERREAARAEAKRLNDEIAQLGAQIAEIEAPYMAQMKAATAALRERRQQARTRALRLEGLARCYRFTVGEADTFAGMRTLCVRGEGDTWEDAFDNAAGKPRKP